MAVRERDDTGWDELPGGLSFSDHGDGDGGEDPPGRRGLRALAWVLVLGMLLGGGGAWAARWLGEADVRAVLVSSTATYGGLLERLRQAPDAEALAAVAVGAPRAAELLEADLRRLTGEGGTRRAAVAAQVAAERDVLLAVGALGELDRAPLRVWGEVHADLAAAVRREQATRASLLLVDPAAARRLPDTTAAVRRVASTVGEAVVGDVTRAAGDLLAELAAATRTAELRDAAGRAEARRSAVTAAGQGLGGSPDAAVLAAFGDALLAVAELQALTPDDTGVWSAVRPRLQSSLQVVADADPGLAAGTVRGRLPLVLDAVDRLVGRAGQAQAEWRAVHDAAVAQQVADAAALRGHAERVRAASGGWPALRRGVEDLAQPDESGDVDDVWAAADALRRSLEAAPAPAGLEPAHTALLDALVAVEAPLRAARRGASGELAAAVAALPSWDAALEVWESSLARAEADVAARLLPPRPDV